MPELPEVETVRRGLEPVMAGARLMAVEQRRADLRFPFPARFAERLTGRRIEALRRRAKYLIADLDGVELLVMHLGMSGSFRIEKPLEVGQTAPAPVGKNLLHDHVAFRLSTGPSIIYNDPRRFGFMQLIARTEFTEHPLFKDIGVEPLGSEFDGATLARLCSGRKAPLKSVLLDQRLIAGLGNIYVCEALHRAGLSPRRREPRPSRRQPGAPRAAARRRHSRGAGRGGGGRRLLIARSPAGGWRARLFPASFPCLWAQ